MPKGFVYIGRFNTIEVVKLIKFIQHDAQLLYFPLIYIT